MGRSRYRALAALTCGAIYVAYVVACSSFESTPVDESDASDSSADAPVDNATTNDANVGSDASDAGADVRDASLAVVCPVGSCRLVFVTSGSYAGNFGGFGNADTLCENLAKAVPALQGRTFRAWLSQTDAGARDFHVIEEKPYVRVDGVRVADGWIQLTSAFGDASVLQAPIQIDEKGQNVGMALVWTGTTYSGFASANHCSNWKSLNGAGQIGRADQTNEAWTDTDVPLGISGICGNPARLYCFER